MSFAPERGLQRTRPIGLWLVFGGACDPADGAVGGAASVGVGDADPFALVDAARAAGSDDLRRVGVICATAEQVEAGRRAGLGAVVAVAQSDPEPLLDAGPDAAVAPPDLQDVLVARWGPSAAPLVLLNPGPGLTRPGVKRAAAGIDICHREEEFGALDRGLRSKLRRVAGVGDAWQIGFVSGSGTAANELAVRAAVRPGKKLAVVVNGAYGERLRETARRAGIETIPVTAAWTDPVDVSHVAAALAQRDVDALCVVHHETTTGLLNPLSELVSLARDAGVRVVVDAISSFGAEDIGVAGSGIDFLTCTSNKCLHGLPGVAFVLVSPAGTRRVREHEPTSVYLDLGGYLDAEAGASPPFTPAIPALAALDRALDELLMLGVERHRAVYADRARFLDEVLDGLGLVQLVAAPFRSRSIRSVRLPEGASFAALHGRLRADGYVVYAGQGPLAREIFRVACMGALSLDDLRGFGDALARALGS